MSSMKPYGFHSTPMDIPSSKSNPINVCAAPEDEPETPRPLGRSVAKTLIDMFDNSDEPVIVHTAAGKAPYTQGYESVLGSDDDEGAEDVDEDADPEILENHKEYAADFLKRMRCEEGIEPEEPDLQEYFAQWDLDETQVIAICRTYANYLAQRVRSRWGNVKKLKAKK